MDKWPIGAFASIDAGFGVHLDVVNELGIPTIQLHAPRKDNRTSQKAHEFKERLAELGLVLTAVFGGFEGESYETIPVVMDTVGLVPKSTRESRLVEMKEISDFSKMLGCNVIALHLGFIPHDTTSGAYREIVATTRDL